jgi:NAD(P)-dependent dehydrogenase (short-subunit alcohol dehydrogenase family)
MSQKIALVTGANRGIGLEVVRQLATRGLRVFLGCRVLSTGQTALRQLSPTSGTVEAIELDVANSDSVTRATRALKEKTDYLDVLVNNAGILLDDDMPVMKTTEEIFMKTLKTNTWGSLQVTQSFVPFLRRSKDPRIVNVSSGAGSLEKMGDYAPAYSISKAALNAVTRQLAAGLPGMRINSVDPGWVRTEMGGTAAPRSVQEGADTIVWLATDAPAEITGQFLRDRQPARW